MLGITYLNNFVDGFLRLLTDWGYQKAPLFRNCHKYPTMMKIDSYTLTKEDPINT